MFLAGIRRLKFAIFLAVLSSTAVFGAKFESDTDVKLFNFFANECGNLEIFPTNSMSVRTHYVSRHK